jgi:hypothetical protein
MKLAVEISYRTVLMLNERDAKTFIDLMASAKIYERQGYGQDAKFKPTGEQFNVAFVADNQLVSSFEESTNED